MDYTVAVVDDSAQDREYVAALVRQWAGEKGHVAIVKEFPSAEAFLFAREDGQDADILLLDIEMGAMNGVDLAKELRRGLGNDAVQLVFITGFPDFIAEGYEVNALHYLMKPVAGEKLSAVLDRAAANLTKAEKRLCVAYDRRTDYIPVSQIYYIEAQKQYVSIHAAGGDYRMKTSLLETKGMLDEYFFQCQRSYLVNLRHVAQIKRDCVVLKGGVEVPISRGMAEKIGREIIRLF